MNQLKWAVAAFILFVGAGCQNDEATINPVLTDSDFRTSADGWSADYSDYGVEQADIIHFEFAHKNLPAPLDTTKKALFVAGDNRSDDLFMFLKKKATGLRPNTEYNLQFDVELASPFAQSSFGIGGSPATSVYMKVGASATEPNKVLRDGHYYLSIDKGEQSNSGKDMIVVGNTSNGTDVSDYKLITRTNQDQPFSAKTNDKGELWLVVGTDSGFEGRTTLYYNHIRVAIK